MTHTHFFGCTWEKRNLQIENFSGVIDTAARAYPNLFYDERELCYRFEHIVQPCWSYEWVYTSRKIKSDKTCFFIQPYNNVVQWGVGAINIAKIPAEMILASALAIALSPLLLVVDGIRYAKYRKAVSDSQKTPLNQHQPGYSSLSRHAFTTAPAFIVAAPFVAIAMALAFLTRTLSTLLEPCLPSAPQCRR